jgi:hypothetical protein
MRYLKSTAFVFKMCFALCAANTSASLSYAQTPLAPAIPFKIIYGHVVVDARFNGKGPFSTEIDNGSQQSFLDDHIADQIDLHPAGLTRISGFGPSDVMMLTSSAVGISLAGALLTGQTLNVTNFQKSQMDCGGKVQAIIGQALFTNYVVTIDFVHSTLWLSDPSTFTLPASAIALPVDIDQNGLPLVAATVNGAAGNFQIDLGTSTGLILFPGFAAANKDKLSYTGSTTESVPQTGGSLAITNLPAGGDIKIGPFGGHLPSIQLFGADPPHVGGVDIAGNFGAGIWQHSVVAFDLSHKRIVLIKPQ